jgi:hypothetical protein
LTSGIRTLPEFDKLASEGIRYNRFHTTAIFENTAPVEVDKTPEEGVPLHDRHDGQGHPVGGSDSKRTHFIYYAGAGRLAETAAPNTKNKSHVITADIEIANKKTLSGRVHEGGARLEWPANLV